MRFKRLLVATKNKGKLNEFKFFLSELPIEIVSLQDLNINKDFEEIGKTYKENAKAKAFFYAKLTNLPVITDDGGIEINALNNEPGIKTRRWLGHESTDKELFNHMIKISKTLPNDNRIAYFKAVVVFALPNEKLWFSQGQVKGVIAQKPYVKLLEGYPFRSFFYLPKIKKYYHEDELSQKEQKQYNHRYKAIQKLIPIVKKELIS